jgi:hypothetical protein
VCQDLRDFRDRDVVALERFLALRGRASAAAASLSISAGLREPVVPPGFLEGLGTTSLTAVERRRVLVDLLPASLSLSSSSSSCSSSSSSVSSPPAAEAAFSLPLSLPLALTPASAASTVVLVEEAEEEERARFEWPPAAETAVEDPEENDGDRSRVRRAEEREGPELAWPAFFPAASLARPRDMPV